MQLPGPSKPGTSGPANSEAQRSEPGDLRGSDSKDPLSLIAMSESVHHLPTEPLHFVKAGAGEKNGNSTQSAAAQGHTL